MYIASIIQEPKLTLMSELFLFEQGKELLMVLFLLFYDVYNMLEGRK